MTCYEKIFAEISDLNPTHLETLALAAYRNLDNVPREGFVWVANLAEQRGGAEWLARFHADNTFVV